MVDFLPSVAGWTGTVGYPSAHGIVAARVPKDDDIHLEADAAKRGRMSHAVLLDFPGTRRGRFLRWLFTEVRAGTLKLVAHVETEFGCFNDQIEPADFTSVSNESRATS